MRLEHDFLQHTANYESDPKVFEPAVIFRFLRENKSFIF